MVQTVKASKGIGRVQWISVDRERSIPSIERPLVVALEALLKQPVPYGHERKVERMVRTIRNRYRTILAGLKVPVNKQLIKLAWEHAVKAPNFILNVNSGDYLPYQIQHGTRHYRTPPRFGEFVAAPVGLLKTKDESRRQVAMIVGFEEHTRAVQVKFMGQKEPLVRDSYSVVQDQEQGLKEFLDANEGSEDLESDEDLDDSVQRLGDTDIEGLIGGEVDLDNAVKNATKVIPSIMKKVVLDHENDFEGGSTDEEEAPKLRRSIRDRKLNRKTDFVYAMVKRVLEKQSVRDDSTTKSMKIICGLVEEAAIKGESGKRAAAKLELEQVWKKHLAIEPVQLTKSQRERAGLM